MKTHTRAWLSVLAVLCIAVTASAQDGAFIQYRTLLMNGGTIWANLGSELAPAIASANWTCGAGWDCSVSGTLNKNADGAGTAVPNPALTIVAGTTYAVTITSNATVGSAAFYIGASSTYTLSNGTVTYYATATSTSNLTLYPSATTARFTITSVSVKALNDATGDLEVQGNLTVRSPATFNAPILTSDGIAGAVAYGFTAEPTTGMFRVSTANLGFSVSGVIRARLGTSYFDLNNNAQELRFGASQDAIISRAGAATLQLGAADAASPVAQTLQAQGVAAGTSDVSGANLTITSGNGRGSAAGSALVFRTPTPVGGGNGAQTMTDRLTINSNAAVFTTSVYTSGSVYTQGYFLNGLSTAGTMTNEFATGYARPNTVTSSYLWTNAMLVAGGAATTWDVTVVVLPAKTQVLNALVVITGQAAGPATVTVQCGDTGTFNNYLLAKSTMVAANTVYGDAIDGSETGTALFDSTAKWIPAYLPSYTATTTVTCRFIAASRVDGITGSTGRVILTTRLLP